MTDEHWRPSKAQLDAFRLAKASVEHGLGLRRLLRRPEIQDRTDDENEGK